MKIEEFYQEGFISNILALGNLDSSAVETCILDTETAFDWLDYYSLEFHQFQAQSRSAGR